jgi:hypothetical protein
MKKTITIDLLLQPPIEVPPPKYGDLYKIACSGDGVTIASWRETWLKNYQLTKDRYGEFASRSFGQLFGVNRHKPAIVIGSGSSLRNSIEALKDNRNQKNPVTTISCLHNFGYFEDEGCHSDYYLTLDSGPIVLTDVTEGRKNPPEYYWEKSKDHVLLCNVASDPVLLDKWQGKIYLFNTLIPDAGIRDEYAKIERFSHYISSGGNALGACMYTAKALMGSGEIIYVGADFCFDYDNHFHSYPTQYDNFKGGGLGNTVRWPDIYGIPRITWPSYMNFAFWFNWVSLNIPGRWVSASEGIMGAFPEGNLTSFKYVSLKNALENYRIADTVQIAENRIENGVSIPVKNEDGSVKTKPLLLEEYFKDSKQPWDMTFF